MLNVDGCFQHAEPSPTESGHTLVNSITVNNKFLK